MLSLKAIFSFYNRNIYDSCMLVFNIFAIFYIIKFADELNSAKIIRVIIFFTIYIIAILGNRNHEIIKSAKFLIAKDEIANIITILKNDNFNCFNIANNRKAFQKESTIIIFDENCGHIHVSAYKKQFKDFQRLCSNNRITLQYDSFINHIMKIFARISSLMSFFFFLLSIVVRPISNIIAIAILISIVSSIIIAILMDKRNEKRKSLLTSGYRLVKQDIDELIPLLENTDFKIIDKNDDAFATFTNNNGDITVINIDRNNCRLHMLSDYSNLKKFIFLCKKNNIRIKL